MLAKTAARYPQDKWPWVYLSHALLQEAKEWTAAEKALRTILTLDPDDQEARRNLQILLQQQSKP